MQTLYPFTAITGQEEMKKALILNAVNPRLGGVLIRGEKGTAKSTAVRALAPLLGERAEVKDCPFSCDPEDPDHACEACRNRENPEVVRRPVRLVELPVSASEDRVVGTLDMERVLKTGEKVFEPGILAMANRNILYVDEVNLLEDHLVDLLLDAAAMGVNTVEREGISYSHPSRFVLVGTMNPEEGDLRPQLIDRFGLVVDVEGEKDPARRVEVVKRRMAFERDPEGFAKAFEAEQKALSEKILQAKALLPEVEMEDWLLELIARIAIEVEVDGHRADLVMLKAALTLAALDGRTKVEKEDVLEAARLALPHRMRRRPFEDGTLDFSAVEALVDAF